MENKKLIAITGGIGSGKSAALSALQNTGYSCLSSDQIVTELYEKHAVKKKLQALFPSAVSGIINLKIDRKKISAIVFSNKAMLDKLTSLITPLVMQEIIRRFKKSKATVFAEVPLLFECGFEKYFDQVIVVMRDKKTRIESVKKRSRLSEEEIIARMDAQFDYDNADLSKFAVIKNNSTLESLSNSVLSVAKTFL